jgi:hypothetical protein
MHSLGTHSIRSNLRFTFHTIYAKIFFYKSDFTFSTHSGVTMTMTFSFGPFPSQLA